MQCKMKRKKLTELQFQLIKDFTLNLYGLCSEEEWGYSDMINEEKRFKINQVFFSEIDACQHLFTDGLMNLAREINV